MYFIYIWHGRIMVIHSMNAYVWCWSKICGSLDEIPSVTTYNEWEWEVVKVKFLMNSNMTLTVLNQCPYQVSTFYTLRFPRYRPDKVFALKVTTARSKVKSRSDHDVAHLHILTNVSTKYQLPTPYGF